MAKKEPKKDFWDRLDEGVAKFQKSMENFSKRVEKWSEEQQKKAKDRAKNFQLSTSTVVHEGHTIKVRTLNGVTSVWVDNNMVWTDQKEKKK